MSCHNEATALVRNSSNGCYSYKNVSKIECEGDLPPSTEQICYCIPVAEVEYGTWSRWGECSVTCGTGERTRYRDNIGDLFEMENVQQDKIMTRLYVTIQNVRLMVDGAVGVRGHLVL